jgi:hypothetical protein
VAGAVTEENNFLLMRERDSELVIRISGTWRLKDGLPSMEAVFLPWSSMFWDLTRKRLRLRLRLSTISKLKRGSVVGVLVD